MKVTIIDRINCQSRKSLRVALASRVIKKALRGGSSLRTCCLSIKGTKTGITGSLQPIWFIITTFLRKSTFYTKIAVLVANYRRTYLCICNRVIAAPLQAGGGSIARFSVDPVNIRLSDKVRSEAPTVNRWDDKRERNQPYGVLNCDIGHIRLDYV